MATRNGLLPPLVTHSAPSNSYYLTKNEPVMNQPTLVAPIALENPDKTSIGYITVGQESEGVYEGAISLQPGPNSVNPTGNQVGLTIRATADGVNVEIGDDAQTTNLLYIAGPSGVAQVYDETYNQPVSLPTITMVQTNPLMVPANPEEVLRCGQAAVALAETKPDVTVSNFFTVPKTGAYMIQTQVTVGNAGVPNTVVIPSTVIGGVPLWESIALSFRVQGGPTVPYASFEIIGGDFYGDQAFISNSIITKTFTSVAFLTTATTYVVTLNAGPNWNIGDGGQIKVELIAMC